MRRSAMLQPPLAAFCANTNSQHFLLPLYPSPGAALAWGTCQSDSGPPRLIQTRIQGGWHPTPSKVLPFLGVKCIHSLYGGSRCEGSVVPLAPACSV